LTVFTRRFALCKNGKLIRTLDNPNNYFPTIGG
jgi:hypothetical protein